MREPDGREGPTRHDCPKAGPRNKYLDSNRGLGATRSLLELRVSGS